MADRGGKQPIESAMTSLLLFGQKISQQNCYLNSHEHDVKDLADCKLQLETRDSAYMQAVAKIDVYERTVAKLSTQLKVSEADREVLLKECKKSQTFISMLESEYEAVIDQLLDYTEDHEQLLRTVDELKQVKEELLRLKVELAAAEDSKVAALTKAVLVEKAVNMENEKNESLLAPASEINKEILSSNLASIEAVEKDLRTELLEKTILADYYHSEIIQSKESLATSVEHLQTVISNERNYSMSIEVEAKQLDEELKDAKEKVSDLKDQVDKVTSEIQSMKDVSFESNERELELQVEIAELKSEIHKNRSRIAAAEAAEARALSTQSGLHLAVQQLALEAETAKKEAQTLKLEMCSGITISVEEYESLIEKSEPKFSESVNRMEVDVLKEELDAAKAEIGNLKLAIEGSLKKAYMAEKAKSAIEDQLRRWREQQKLRRAASEAAQEQPAVRSVEQEKPPAYDKRRTVSMQDGRLFNYIPLGKILNMKY